MKTYVKIFEEYENDKDLNDNLKFFLNMKISKVINIPGYFDSKNNIKYDIAGYSVYVIKDDDDDDDIDLETHDYEKKLYKNYMVKKGEIDIFELVYSVHLQITNT